MVYFGAGCYDAIETIRGVIEKLSNNCFNCIKKRARVGRTLREKDVETANT